MKKYILLFILAVGNIAFAANDNNIIKKIVSGKVVDKISGEEIAGAEIRVDGTIVYTDLNGNFSVIIDITKPEAFIKLISYNEMNVTLDPLSYNTIVIELAAR